MFTALAVFVVPVLFFVVLEGALRLVGYGDDEPLFVAVPGYEQYLIPNPNVGRRYFRLSSIVPGPPHDPFLRRKPEGSLRIFVQGGSTGAGFPFGHGGMFSRMLRQHLIKTFPDRRVEVVNTSMAAVNSYTLLDLSDEILEAEPDAVVIYTGHNEYYGALGVGSVESPGASRILVRVMLALDGLRIVQGLRTIIERLRGLPERQTRAEGATLMEEMAGDRLIARGGRLFELGVGQFRTNLEHLLCKYRDAGVPVYVSTLVANERDQPPLASGLQPNTDQAKWKSLREESSNFLAAGDTAGAMGAIDDLVAFDSTSADAWFTKGRLLQDRGKTEKARVAFLQAKDFDELRFRAPEDMNTVIREVANRCGASVVDMQSAFVEASGAGSIGHELVFEHVHPNLDGYVLMSNKFYEAIFRDHRAGELNWPSTPAAALTRRESLVTRLDSTLASWHIRRLTNNWPFVERGTTRPDTLKISTVVDSLALELLRGNVGWADATAQVGAADEARGDLESALRAALALIDEQPYNARPYLVAANLYVRQERFAAALQYFGASDQRKPSIEARRGAGTLLANTGRFEAAIPWLERALELEPNDIPSLFFLGVSDAATGATDEARKHVQRMLELEPNHPAARALLQRIEQREAANTNSPKRQSPGG